MSIETFSGSARSRKTLSPYNVPLISVDGVRPHSVLSAQKKVQVGGAGALDECMAAKHAVSIDGLPSVDTG